MTFRFICNVMGKFVLLTGHGNVTVKYCHGFEGRGNAGDLKDLLSLGLYVKNDKTASF